MATWNVSAGDKSVTVEAANWLGALSTSMPQLGLGQGALGRLVCNVLDGGGAEASDPVSGVKVRIVPAGTASSPSESDDVFQSDAAASGLGSEAPATPTRVQTNDDIDRMEVLFDRCGEISEARDVRSACHNALRILHDLVPADAGAVLLETRTGEQLRFAAAVGPSSSKVIDTTIPAREGIAGFSHTLCMGVMIEDVARDDRHYNKVDKAAGYRTKSILAVPIRTPDGGSFGCLELLNPPQRFSGDDFTVAEMVSNSLGAWLHGSLR
jgi:hypothetical protein